MSQKNKILVVGSKGQLGCELMDRAETLKYDIVGKDVDELDITDKIGLSKYIDALNLSTVVNAAAYTAVDQAENDSKLSFAINRDGPGYLARACDKKSIPLIHISTDYVFDGSKSGAYTEADPVSPLGVYAQSKAEGEIKVATNSEKHIIIRTAWLYGVHGNNFVKTMLRLGRWKKKIKVVSDQKGCPTSTEDLANVVLSICNRIHEKKGKHWGIFHYCGKGETTWHGFAKEIFAFAVNYEKLEVKHIEAIQTHEFPTSVRRPQNSVLNCEKIEKVFGISPKPWQESLRKMLSRYYHEQNRATTIPTI